MLTPENPAVLVRDFKSDETFIITRSDIIQALSRTGVTVAITARPRSSRTLETGDSAVHSASVNEPALRGGAA